ncbi:MAG: adenine phosphoribosyltransferase [Candidatus Izemoplasmataceae bacterium]
MRLKDYIKNVPDFPKKGIQFKDITPLIADGQAFRYAVMKLSDYAREREADVVVGPDARGFIFGTPIAFNLGIGFIPVRKPGKLPRETYTERYALEYDENALSIHKDDIKTGQRVLIVDDLLATGGTIQATIKLVEKAGGNVVGVAFLIELAELKGRHQIGHYPIYSLLTY